MTEQHPDENDVKKKIRDLLDEHGWFHFPVPANQFGRSGVSDRLALRKGIFLAIEAKHKKATGTVPQEEFLANVRAQGGIGIVVNMAGLPRFEKLLKLISETYP